MMGLRRLHEEDERQLQLTTPVAIRATRLTTPFHQPRSRSSLPGCRRANQEEHFIPSTIVL